MGLVVFIDFPPPNTPTNTNENGESDILVIIVTREVKGRFGEKTPHLTL
jgi:hypothetical protein